MTSDRQPVVGISGSYGGLNAGDEAILTSAVEQLRLLVPRVEVVVFSRDAEHTRAHHQVDRVVPAREAVRDEILPEVRRLDLLLLGGGGILYDREAQSYLHVVGIAQELGVPTATLAIGVGPLERAADRQAVTEALNGMARITVRETSAKRLLEELGVEREIEVTADPALLLEPEPLSRDRLREEGISDERRVVGMSVREPGEAAPGIEEGSYHILLANAADFIVDRFDADVVFVPLERGDIREAHRVMGEMAFPDRATVLKGDYGPRDLLGLMSHLELAVGMRLHFLVFAALAGIPLQALPYAAKVASFLEDLSIPTPRLVHREHSGPLLASIDRLWDSREEHRMRVQERLPEMQARAERTFELCLEVLGARSPRAHGRERPREEGGAAAGPGEERGAAAGPREEGGAAGPGEERGAAAS